MALWGMRCLLQNIRWIQRQMEMGEKGGYLASCLLVKHHGGAFPGKISRGNLDLLIIVAIDA